MTDHKPRSLALPSDVASQRLHSGRFCDIFYGEQIERLLRGIYGRDELCIKALREGDTWEGQSLTDVTRVQNIGAIYGVAPRVYDVVRLEGSRLAQVIEYLPVYDEPRPRDVWRLADFLLSLDIGTSKRVRVGGVPKWDIVVSIANWGQGRFLDWGGYYLKEEVAYLDDLKRRVSVRIASRRRGEPTEVAYQRLAVLGIAGNRDTAHRVQAMHLDQIDFAGKTVLDLGANLGAFSFYAHDQGAQRVVAVDVPVIAVPMREVANWLGYWNVDWVSTSLPGPAAFAGIRKFDIVLALSICNHVGGYGSWIADLCADTLVLEGHGGDKPEKYAEALRRDFATIDLVGYTSDHMTRPVFICRRPTDATR